MVTNNQCAIGCILSGGETSDARTGRLLIDPIGRTKDLPEEGPMHLVLDRAYEGWETRLLAFEGGTVR
jgi:hypothetical protein